MMSSHAFSDARISNGIGLGRDLISNEEDMEKVGSIHIKIHKGSFMNRLMSQKNAEKGHKSLVDIQKEIKAHFLDLLSDRLEFPIDVDICSNGKFIEYSQAFDAIQRAYAMINHRRIVEIG